MTSLKKRKVLLSHDDKHCMVIIHKHSMHPEEKMPKGGREISLLTCGVGAAVNGEALPVHLTRAQGP